MQGLVWLRESSKILVVPMRIDGVICGVQLIDEEGGKKFLTGQATKGATFAMGQGPRRIWCEGYATALSVHKAACQTRLRVQVVATFSAHNMQTLAKDGHVVADNDASFAGEMAAKATGRPYWISPQVGEDFNDHANRVGGFSASQAILKLVRGL
jgi:putative DNA primase/helicase